MLTTDFEVIHFNVNNVVSMGSEAHKSISQNVWIIIFDYVEK